MAELLKKILGDKLYTLPEDHATHEYYPSPNKLKNKVIIKDKGLLPGSGEHKNSIKEINIYSDINLQEANEENIHIEQKLKNLTEWKDLKFNTLFERYDEIYRFTPRIKPAIFSFNSAKEKKLTLISTKPFSLISEQKLDPPNTNNKKLKIEDLQFSSGLISNEIKSSVSNQDTANLKKNKEKNPFFQKTLAMFGIKMNLESNRSIWNISSINEEKISKLLKEKEVEIIDFHRKYFTRIYPSGKRVDSSNYDPIDAFNSGSQIIALNVQTPDIPLLLYFSKFIENGGKNCGYVLKPPFLQHNASTLKYIKDFKNIQKIINIKVISGQQLRPENENDVRDVADPYVEVNIRGSSKDEAENKSFRSITVKNNGFNPIFNLECSFKITCPDICLIVFKVFDEEGGLKKNERIGWYSIPFHCIREGYRIVPLLNSNLKSIEFSYLFCYINIQVVC